ncbi:TraR/DksA family transcriptional regulator [Pseudomonas aeruginosa]|nr:TraR/DksA family transcriptional regulator [Pseudomonas aeruginosa]
MPDACDFATDLQLDIAAAFMDARASRLAMPSGLTVLAPASHCSGCGQPLSLDRVLAMPGTEHCAPCKGIAERKEARPCRR